MPLIRIYFNPLNPQDRKEFPVTAGGQIIHFLTEHYPNGFDGLIRVFVSSNEIQLDDLDYEIQEKDLITILVMPAGLEAATLSAIYSAAIGALVGAAIGYVINLIFPPKAPGFAKEETESPVYSLNATRNATRLGDPIASHYGTVSYPPDFCSAPYSFFFEGSNDQYVDELLCLGTGEYTVSELYIGDTPVTAIEPGAVQYWLFGPSEHNQTQGTIGGLIDADNADSPVPWLFWENVFTSPEVENWEFNDDRSDEVSVPTPFAGSVFASVDGNPGYIGNVDGSLDIRTGDTITLANTASNNGSFLISSVVVDPLNSAIVRLFETLGSPQSLVDEQPLPGGTTYVLNTGSDNTIAGPFRAQKDDQELRRIDCDIIFAKGLYRVDGTDGTIKTNSVTMEFSYQQIDTDGIPIGAPVVKQYDFDNYRSRNPVRSTVTSGLLDQGQYEVTVRRVTPISDDTRKIDTPTWAGLKGYIVNSQQPVYSNTTLLAVRMKATNGLGSAARSRIRVTATRNLAVGISSNPITIIKDIWNDTQYGLGRPLDELDLTTMDSLETAWASGPYFNGSFDQRGTGYDAMESVASMTGSKVIQVGGLTSVALDRQQPVRTALFNSANIVKDSLQVRYTFDTQGDYDGVQIEYRDPDTFQPQFLTHPGSSVRPSTFVLFGCTDPVYAQQYAVYLFNVTKIRRKQVTFTTELEGLIPQFSDRIAIAHPLPDWGTSGVIVEVIDPVTYRLDSFLDWAGDKVMMLRSDTGTPSSIYSVTRGAQNNIVVFPEVPDVTVNGPDLQEPTSYVFGDDVKIVKDFILTKIAPQGDTLVEVEGQTYTANIFTDGPPHMRV